MVAQARLRDNRQAGQRSALENNAVAHTTDATAAAMAEIRELKQTIVALREELER